VKSLSNLKKFFLLAGDIIILYASLYFALLIRYLSLPDARLWQDHFSPFTIIFIGWVLIFYIANLYDLRLAVNNTRFWQLTGKSMLVAALFSVAFFYAFPSIGIAPKTNLLIYIIVFTVLFALWRQFYNWSLSSYLPKNNLAIIGFDDQVKDLIKEITEKPHLGFKASFIVNGETAGETDYQGIPLRYNYADLAEQIKQHKISTVVLSADPHQSVELRNSLFACLPLKLSFVSLPLFYENFTGKVPVSVINQMWFLENLSEGNKLMFDLVKNICDFILALVIFIITLPLWLIIAIIIKLESRGPVFHAHTRLGKAGEPFKFYKFRSMREENNDRSPTVSGDRRITGFGLIMRRTRLDELPQAINVIRREMSFVGPRPERPELVAELEKLIPFYRERMLVKPGVTGWDQISGEYHSPSREDTLKKLQYDLFYIKNRSLYLDVSIILKTILTVLSRAGM
jgi:exopolysaccharide biosynthesis polyprenyl glycosylphosphotransferase